jgi:DNA-directed RNA polymerase subunit RPC12/RpoP
MPRGRPAKLTGEHVTQVRKWLHKGIRKGEIADRLGVHRNSISAFCQRHELEPDFSEANNTTANIKTASQLAKAYRFKLIQGLNAEGLRSADGSELESRLNMVVTGALKHYNPRRGVKWTTYLIAGFLNAYKTYRRELRKQAGLDVFDNAVRRRRRVTKCQNCGVIIPVDARKRPFTDKNTCPYCYSKTVMLKVIYG